MRVFILTTGVLATLAFSAYGEDSKIPAFPKAADTHAGMDLAAPGKNIDDDDHIKAKLSTLWTLESLNMIGADVLASYIPGTQDEVIKTAGGKDQVKNFMLAGAVIYEIPISMIFLSRYVPYHANRWLNWGAAALTTLFVIGGGSTDPHYLFLATAEVATMSYVAWTAFQWKDSESLAIEDGPREQKQNVALHFNPQGKQLRMVYAYRF